MASAPRGAAFLDVSDKVTPMDEYEPVTTIGQSGRVQNYFGCDEGTEVSPSFETRLRRSSG